MELHALKIHLKKKVTLRSFYFKMRSPNAGHWYMHCKKEPKKTQITYDTNFGKKIGLKSHHCIIKETMPQLSLARARQIILYWWKGQQVTILKQSVSLACIQEDQLTTLFTASKRLARKFRLHFSRRLRRSQHCLKVFFLHSIFAIPVMMMQEAKGAGRVENVFVLRLAQIKAYWCPTASGCNETVKLMRGLTTLARASCLPINKI